MLNKWFRRSEFSCKCGCNFDTVDAQLLEVLTDVREHFNSPVVITSGCRCDLHNHTIGGASKSQHTTGKAADFYVRDVAPEVVHAYLEDKYPDKFGLGLYSNRIHFDSRSYKARWYED